MNHKRRQVIIWSLKYLIAPKEVGVIFLQIQRKHLEIILDRVGMTNLLSVCTLTCVIVHLQMQGDEKENLEILDLPCKEVVGSLTFTSLWCQCFCQVF